MYSVDIYNRVRRSCLKDGMSAREASRVYGKDRKTIAKMLRHEVPPGYRRSKTPRRPTLDAYAGVIDEIMRTDKSLIKKQRYTAKRADRHAKLTHLVLLTSAQNCVEERTGVIHGKKCSSTSEWMLCESD